MAIIAFIFMLFIGLGIAVCLGAIVYLIVKRLNADTESYERRSN